MTEYLVPAFWIWMAAQLPVAMLVGACLRAGQHEERDGALQQEWSAIAGSGAASAERPADLAMTPNAA